MKRVRRISLSVIALLASSLIAVGCNKTDGGKTDNSPKQPADEVVALESIDLQERLQINVGESFKLQPTFEPLGANPKVSWSSSETAVATVDANGNVTGVAAGTVIIRASAEGKHADCTVTVKSLTVPVESVSLEVGVINLNVSETYQINATVLPNNATDKTLTYESAKVDVATVSNTGLVTAKAAGSSLITVKSNNDKRATVLVKVKDLSQGQDEEEQVLSVTKVDSLENRDDFIMGMDASAVLSLENAGVKYKNFAGEEQDVFKTMKDSGITDIRIRIWNDPYQTSVTSENMPKTLTDLASYNNTYSGNVAYSYGGGNCDVNNAVEISKRCQAVGLGVILDFHYSDFWADPGKQQAPKAWKGLSNSDKATALYDFTKDSLQKIKATNVDINVVQLGNETTRSIMGASVSGGNISDQAALYFNKGAQAVREVTGAVNDGGAKVAVHLTNPNTQDYLNFAKNLLAKNVDYDVLGTSYYPGFHGMDLTSISNKLKAVHDQYGKEIMMLETSHPYTVEDYDGNGNTSVSVMAEPFTIQGQTNQTEKMIKLISDLGDYGLGICYWEGTWIAPAKGTEASLAKCNEFGCGWASAKAGPASVGGDGYQENDVLNAGGVKIENQAFFDNEGNPLKSLDVFKLVRTGQSADPLCDYSKESELFYEVEKGPIVLPSKVDVILNDGSRLNTVAIWDFRQDDLDNWIQAVGIYTVHGTTEYGGDIVCKIHVNMPNILQDGSFEDGKDYAENTGGVKINSPWVADVTTAPDQLWVSANQDNKFVGAKSLHFWSGQESGQVWKVYQDVDMSKITNYGKYTISVSFQGDSCGATIDDYEVVPYIEYVKEVGSTPIVVKGPKLEGKGFQLWNSSLFSVMDIDATVTSIKVGVSVNIPTKVGDGAWGNFDDLQFYYNPNN